MQTARKNVKALLLKLIAVSAIVYICFFLASFFNQSSYTDCERYTKELNGGVKEFKGNKYTVKLCGKGKTSGSGNEVRLQIFGDKGELLALRYFTVHWNDATPRALQYSDEEIFYYDYSQSKSLSTISMPPSKIDWINTFEI
jgi:hypothetical protein